MEEDLLGDLIEYRKSKDKGVVTAARGLLQLFREVNPGMLKKRERVSWAVPCSLAVVDKRTGQSCLDGFCQRTGAGVWTYQGGCTGHRGS